MKQQILTFKELEPADNLHFSLKYVQSWPEELTQKYIPLREWPYLGWYSGLQIPRSCFVDQLWCNIQATVIWCYLWVSYKFPYCVMVIGWWKKHWYSCPASKIYMDHQHVYIWVQTASWHCILDCPWSSWYLITSWGGLVISDTVSH